MQLKLKSVHLRNIRIHKDYLFEPNLEGVTAIVGKTGHGKSTIVDGIAWALFGTKPNSSMKAAEMRRMGAGDDEAAYVDIHMAFNGQDLRVKRNVNSKGGVSCECWIDNVQEAGPAVSHTKRWLSKTLGLDEDGFLSAVLVQQKQVDALVAASPTVRRSILEKLTGITAVTNATDIAHDEERSYNKAVGSVKTDDKKLPKLEDRKAQLEQRLESVEGTIESLKNKILLVNKDGSALKAHVDSMEQLATEYHSLTSQKAILKSEVDMLQERQNDLMDKQKSMKADLPDNSISVQQIDGLTAQLEEKESDLSSTIAHIVSLKSLSSKRISDIKVQERKDHMEDVQKQVTDIHIDEIRSQMDSARASITSSKNQIKAYTKSMHDFDAGESTTCPTCLQEVHDPEHITNEFLSRIEHLKQTIEDDTSRLKDLNTQSEQYSSSLASLQSLQKELRQIEHDNGVADQASSELIAQMAKEKTLKSDVKTLRRTVSSFAADREKRRNYDSLIKDFKTTTNKINVSSEKLHDIEKSISEMDGKFSERKLESDRKALDRKKDEKTDLVMKLTKKTGDRDLFHEKINSTDLEIQHIKDAIESKRKLLGKLEIASGSASVLSTFREHMILNSIPQITDYASDLIRKITEGKFTDIQIDPKFNMAVSTDDGVERNVMTLSGGELSTVAICMRVAISVMLSGGSPSLMMLDEVLTAMDSDRAEAILNAIQDLNDGQIIIIAHNEIIKSVADSIIEL